MHPYQSDQVFIDAAHETMKPFATQGGRWLGVVVEWASDLLVATGVAPEGHPQRFQVFADGQLGDNRGCLALMGEEVGPLDDICLDVTGEPTNAPPAVQLADILESTVVHQ